MPLSTAAIPDLGAIPTASDVIADHLRAAIADGSLGEADPIRQDEIARLFNVSKIPVREALKRLEAEGLVEFHRNRGAVVTSLTEPEVAEIFEVRAVLEAAAIRRSVPHMAPATLDRAAAHYEEFRSSANTGVWSLLNWQFHSSLYEDARRPFMIRQIRAMNDRIERYLRVQLTLADGKRLSDREHLDILQACKVGEPDRAATLTYKHIMHACESLLTHQPRRG